VTLSPNAVRSQEALAAVLALIAGYIDSYSLLYYNVYASFMSGNTTQTGLHAGRGELAAAVYNLLPIPLFVIGIFVGTFLRHTGMPHAFRLFYALVAVLVAAAMAADWLGPAIGWFSIVNLSLAMGVMNTALTRVGGQSVSLGYVTGDLNHLADHLALAVKRVPVPQPQGSWDTHARRAAQLMGVWSAFLIGAVLAGAATSHFAALTLLPPALILLLLAALGRANGEGTEMSGGGNSLKKED
jgi:uncharacterized membrane protein YoaK (UPF0700 family)